MVKEHFGDIFSSISRIQWKYFSETYRSCSLSDSYNIDYILKIVAGFKGQGHRQLLPWSRTVQQFATEDHL